MLSGMDDDDALLRLHHAAGPSGWLRRLLDHAASEAAATPALAAWSAGDAAWAAAGAPAGARALAMGPAAASASRRARQWRDGGPGRQIIGWASPLYPGQLAASPAPPGLLYAEGRAERLWWPQIAIVGSRAPTPAGRERAGRWAAAFAGAGFVVTSGLAAGIDAAAHGACLAAPGSIAVMGTGPDACFPAGHARLKAAIAVEGCVLSEYPPGTPARAGHFPARNRIIAGLALATVVVEAAQRSGALITARLAAEAGREVFALPGAPENPKAQGCHRLIRDGAILADHPEQVVEALAGAAARVAPALRARLDATAAAAGPPRRPGPEPAPAPASLPAEHAAVLAALGHEGADFDELLTRSGLTGCTLASILSAMELEGRLMQQHGVYHPCGSAYPTGADARRRRMG